MKITFKVLAALAAIGFAGSASAQNSATQQATATATVVLPITLIPGPGEPDAQGGGTQLSFGNIIPPATGTGIIQVSPA
jgi:hypothetical protein